MKNRYGDEYIWEKLSDDTYKFCMKSDSLSMMYCRMGGRPDQNEIDFTDLGFFDPSGGPYITLGYVIENKEIIRIYQNDERDIIVQVHL